MKILVVCRAFHNVAGGIERMAGALMNEMARRGHEVSLLTWDRDSPVAFYGLDESIRWHTLDIGDYREKAGWLLRLRRARRIRAIVREIQPDVILAFQHGTFMSTRLYTLGLGCPVIAAEREAPARFAHLRAAKYKDLIYQSFRLAKAVTIQMESFRTDYPAYLHARIVTIPNPVYPASGQASPGGSMSMSRTLLSVGRLSYQKNYFCLIDAFSALAPNFPDWILTIAGEGEDRSLLEKRVADYNLQDRISLPGAAKDTGFLYRSAHLFCLPSRWEGFPNVVAEALSHGLPVVGFSGCAGTSDLVRHGENGLLAAGNDNPDSLAATLAELMSDPDRRQKMGIEAAESMKIYQPDRIFDLWETLFTRCVRKRR